MKKLSKKISMVFLAGIIMCSCLAFTASAAATSSISLSSKSLTVNQPLTVTVTVNGGEAMYGTQFNVNYDPAVLRFDSGDSATGGAGSVTVVGTPAGKTKDSYSLNFTTLNAGTSSVSVTNGQYVGDAETPFAGSSVAVPVSDAAQSANADLKSLTLSSGSLSPKFSASKTAYTASVPFAVTQCKIYATASDAASKVAVSGDEALNVGENKRTITVTAPSGAQKVYTVTVTRREEGADPAPEPENPAPDPLSTTIKNTAYSILADISGVTLPKGLTAGTADYNGTTVSVATNEKLGFDVYYLKAADTDTAVPYILNDETKEFEKLKIVLYGDNAYILLGYPKEFAVPDEFYNTNIKIGEFKADCFANSNDEKQEYYYVYCFYDGNLGMYRYDSIENTLQRSPEFEVLELAKNEEEVSGGIISKFTALTTNGKIVVICILIAIIGALGLITVLFVKLIRRGGYADAGNELVFDDLSDNNSFITPDDDMEQPVKGKINEMTEITDLVHDDDPE